MMRNMGISTFGGVERQLPSGTNIRSDELGFKHYEETDKLVKKVPRLKDYVFTQEAKLRLPIKDTIIERGKEITTTELDVTSIVTSIPPYPGITYSESYDTTYSTFDTTEPLSHPTKRETLATVIKRERQAFEEMKDNLLKDEKLLGKFVAIFKEGVVDFDEDEEKLVKRMYKKYGYSPMYIQKVEEKEAVEEIPSPFL